MAKATKPHTGVAPAKKKNTLFKDEIAIPRRLVVPKVPQPPVFSHGPRVLQGALAEATTSQGPEGKQPTTGPVALATKPEWYVYWVLTERMHMTSGVDFTYRGEVANLSSLARASQLDFTFPGLNLAFEIQGMHWHYELGTAKIVEDQYRKAQMMGTGWQIIFLDEDRIVADSDGRSVEWLVREAFAGREHTYAINPYVLR